jgi:nitroimidazol reductase NimA-like FMN-containing flavoprotein (pyridoxamine 5'-phosphate oxidase superfamily)
MAEMRRKDRQLETDEAREILTGGVYGVLSTVGPEGEPYGVPLSYVLLGDGQIYFHCALAGRKLDHLRHDARVSFCVVAGAEAVLKKGTDFTTRYASTIVFGRAAAVEDEELKTAALLALAEKYLPQHLDAAPDSIEKALDHTAVYAIKIEAITGKANR